MSDVAKRVNPSMPKTCPSINNTSIVLLKLKFVVGESTHKSTPTKEIIKTKRIPKLYLKFVILEYSSIFNRENKNTPSDYFKSLGVLQEAKP